MEVILNKDVKGIGKALDKVKVNEGYARNFLLPKGLAKLADNKAISEANSKKQAKEHKKDVERENALNIKEKLEKAVLEFRLKMGEGSKLFGSVTNKEIKEKLLEVTAFDIDKKKIELETSIKTAGMYTANIKLYEGVVVKLKVRVVGI